MLKLFTHLGTLYFQVMAIGAAFYGGRGYGGYGAAGYGGYGYYNPSYAHKVGLY